MIRIRPAKIKFVLLSAFFYNTIMFVSAPFLTYVYYYFIPIVYLLIHYKWLFSKFGEIGKKRLVIVFFGLITQIIGSLVIPVAMGTYDFTYFTGPLLQVIKFLIAYLFLLCVYEKKFGKEDSSDGFTDTFIYAIACYVIGTLIICIIPSFHQWIIDNIWISEYSAWQIRQSDAYTRIGWSGFSNFFPTLYCSIAVIICLTKLLGFKGQRRSFIKYNTLAFICLAGNFCYGRIGVIVSVIAYLLYFNVLLWNRPGKTFIYPIVIVFVVVIFSVLITHNQAMMNWFNWAFAQILQYKRSGSFATYTVTSLQDMYIIPSVKTFFFGDGLYKGSDTAYYMGTDVGWLRPIYFYGIMFSLIGFACAIYLIKRYSVQLYSDNKTQRRFSHIVMFVCYILFESKGEVFNVFIAIFILFLLTNKRIITTET